MIVLHPVPVANNYRYATLRTRLRCEVTANDGELIAISHVMNECVIDCESHLSLCTLETVRSLGQQDPQHYAHDECTLLCTAM